MNARVNEYKARDGSVRPIELAYDVIGTRGKPLVLIMGIGAQRIFWDDELCHLFVDAGFQVVRFDHRDIGESTRLDAPVPKPFPLLARTLVGRDITAPYTLRDMARDVVGLIDALGWDSAHVAGTSLGGMVAQQMAIDHPARVRSLTSIMSTPGGRRYLPEPRALRALFAPAPKSVDEAGLHIEKLFTEIGSKAWPHDIGRLRRIGMTAYERGMSPRGFLRHFAAVLATFDRRPHLRDVKVPTLVVHGSCDPMFPLRAGRDMARLVPQATWLPIAGMGHDVPPPIWPTLVRAIARHADRAESSKS